VFAELAEKAQATECFTRGREFSGLAASFVITVSACSPSPQPELSERVSPSAAPTAEIAPRHAAVPETEEPSRGEPTLQPAPKSGGRTFVRSGKCYWQRDYKCPDLGDRPVPCNPPLPVQIECPADAAD